MFGVDDIIGAGLKLIDKFVPDPVAKAKAQQDYLAMESKERLEMFGAKANIINTEAASSHWLAANWRPLTMLTFVALIVARWFGFAAPDITPAEYIELWGIIKLGIGGYVIGRSAEKVVPALLAKSK